MVQNTLLIEIEWGRYRVPLTTVESNFLQMTCKTSSKIALLGMKLLIFTMKNHFCKNCFFEVLFFQARQTTGLQQRKNQLPYQTCNFDFVWTSYNLSLLLYYGNDFALSDLILAFFSQKLNSTTQRVTYSYCWVQVESVIKRGVPQKIGNSAEAVSLFAILLAWLATIY